MIFDRKGSVQFLLPAQLVWTEEALLPTPWSLVIMRPGPSITFLSSKQGMEPAELGGDVIGMSRTPDAVEIISYCH